MPVTAASFGILGFKFRAELKFRAKLAEAVQNAPKLLVLGKTCKVLPGKSQYPWRKNKTKFTAASLPPPNLTGSGKKGALFPFVGIPSGSIWGLGHRIPQCPSVPMSNLAENIQGGGGSWLEN